MLNPDVCRRCRGESGRWMDIDLKEFLTWSCPNLKEDHFLHGTVGVEQNPPPDCEHKLEHAVYESVNIDKIGRD